jgi:hypothetical protein
MRLSRNSNKYKIKIKFCHNRLRRDKLPRQGADSDHPDGNRDHSQVGPDCGQFRGTQEPIK